MERLKVKLLLDLVMYRLSIDWRNLLVVEPDTAKICIPKYSETPMKWKTLGEGGGRAGGGHHVRSSFRKYCNANSSVIFTQVPEVECNSVTENKQVIIFLERQLCVDTIGCANVLPTHSSIIQVFAKRFSRFCNIWHM